MFRGVTYFLDGQHSASVPCGDLDPGVGGESNDCSVGNLRFVCLYVTQSSNSWGSAELSLMPSSSLLLDSSRILNFC